MVSTKYFQFTTSQGGRQKERNVPYTVLIFQFTTSQGGRLLKINSDVANFPFNSRPHKEVDCPGSFYFLPTDFFQFTTSQGGRQPSEPAKPADNTFQFTTSQGGRPFHLCCAIRLLSFNSRPHKEVDPGRTETSDPGGSFNSRPHKEVDNLIFVASIGGTLSIHDLTRRST